MGKLSTHVLDTANGCPAAGMVVTLQRLDARLLGVVLNNIKIKRSSYYYNRDYYYSKQYGKSNEDGTHEEPAVEEDKTR
ncbi:MAG TPA: hydroxyisourate hydrolase [Anaerolineaceae bacterium]|nr:hydroxyisourate hydrolase [Anaerolineaceae bacterium]